jgi:hypothetical protein
VPILEGAVPEQVRLEVVNAGGAHAVGTPPSTALIA